MSKSYNQSPTQKTSSCGIFKSLVFFVNFQFAEGTSIETVDEIVDRFINEVIQSKWSSLRRKWLFTLGRFSLPRKIGKCDESHRETVKNG